ncbi:hypothetical protein CFIMG_005879RA [Ceratocystis fimbriata CBS 114723]|uniref:DUF7514 domain-containing protein n=1 Tax=Ceratocystis fimbriata CBS 114723 TaxID=1035309 RepID=A0A2C5WN13_9PEZI|nr:hypothetical protein CFIMG_005879RA [Ceratocystis fimbriata CBS 114723]
MAPGSDPTSSAPAPPVAEFPLPKDSASTQAPNMPIIYKDMFVKQPGEHPVATRQFCDLAIALADYISSSIGDLNSKILTPSKMADFYRLVSTGDSWDSFWLDTNAIALSQILRTIGAFHSLEPTSNPYEPPSIPALTREGFVRWLSLQILLSPEDNIAYLQYAVQNFCLRHPVTGQRFPPNLPSVVFRRTPDPEVTNWHNRCGDKLKKRLEHQQKREKREKHERREKRQKEHESEAKSAPAPDSKQADSSKLHPTATASSSAKHAEPVSKTSKSKSSKSPEAEATSAKRSFLRSHIRSTSASLLPEKTTTSHDIGDGHRHRGQTRMRSFEHTSKYDKDRSMYYECPEIATKYYDTSKTPLPKYQDSPTTNPMHNYPRDGGVDGRRHTPTFQSHSYSYQAHTWTPPQILRHSSVTTPIHQTSFTPSPHGSMGSNGSFPPDMENRHINTPETSSPRRRSHRHRAEHGQTASGAIPMSSTPRIRVSMDKAASRAVPFIISSSPRNHYFGRTAKQLDDENDEYIYSSSANFEMSEDGDTYDSNYTEDTEDSEDDDESTVKGKRYHHTTRSRRDTGTADRYERQTGSLRTPTSAARIMVKLKLKLNIH